MPEILLSIYLLITTLSVASSYEEHSDTERFLPLHYAAPTLTPGPVTELLTEQLLQAGWYPWKIQQILTNYSYLTIYYISRLQTPTAPHITHTAYTTERYIGNNINIANYTTKHADALCSYPHSPIPSNKLRSIIAQGSVPVIRIQSYNTDQVSLEIKKASSRTQYITISHI